MAISRSKPSKLTIAATIFTILGVCLAFFQFATGRQTFRGPSEAARPPALADSGTGPNSLPQESEESKVMDGEGQVQIKAASNKHGSQKLLLERGKGNVSANNETQEMVTVTGYSAAGQSEYNARQAAEMDAKRRLAVKIKGVLVKGKIKTKDGKVVQDESEIRVNAILRLARKVSEERLPDGSFKVVMEAPIRQGDRGK